MKSIIAMLLLKGEHAEDEKFLAVLRDALPSNQLAGKVRIDRVPPDLTSIVARGVAEFQRRRQQGWLGCAEPQHCNASMAPILRQLVGL